MATTYYAFDGDYVHGRGSDYTRLLNDLQIAQGIDIGPYREICVSLEKDDTLYIVCSNDEGTEWEFSHNWPIPPGWSIDTIRELFEGNVYMETEDYVEPDQEEEEE